MNQGNRLMDSADDWMSREITTIFENEFVASAASIMTQKQVGSLVVMQKPKSTIFSKKEDVLTGLLTDTDIVRKVIATQQNPQTLPVQTVMSTPVRTIPANIPTYEISKYVTEYKVKHLPVMRDGKLVGVLSLTDLMYAMMRLGKNYELGDLLNSRSKLNVPNNISNLPMKVGHWMQNPVITVEETASLLFVAQLMNQHRLGALPVTTATHELVGIVTDTDLVRYLTKGGADFANTAVSQIMTPNVVTTPSETKLNDLTTLMESKKLRRIPIVDNNELVGIISVTDLTNLMLQLNNVSGAHRLVEMLYKGNIGL